MGYYIRVLGTNLNEIPLEVLRASASPALIEAETADGEAWESVILRHPDGIEIAQIERNPVEEGELGAEELQEFVEDVPHYQPQSAARWLVDYFSRAKVIYTFQVLSGTDTGDGWSRLHAVYNTVWKAAGGILQADGEGFSNEAGNTILWQFGESAAGLWSVGVLTDGSWTHFEIDLANAEHREKFQQGLVPPGVRHLS